MDYRIISLPSFTAVTSGPDPDMDFSPQGRLGKFNAYFSAITPSPRDAFMPRDFLFFNAGAGGLEWWWALEEGMPDGGFPKVFFEGGIYLTYTYRDHDQEENNRLYQEAVAFVNSSAVFQLDERPGHYGAYYHAPAGHSGPGLRPDGVLRAHQTKAGLQSINL